MRGATFSLLIVLLACGEERAPDEAPAARLEEVGGEAERAPDPRETGEVVGTEGDQSTPDRADEPGPTEATGEPTRTTDSVAPSPNRMVHTRERGVRIAGVTRVAGTGDRAIVRRVVRTRIAAFRGCYERAIGERRVEGNLLLRVTIDFTGEVTAAELTSDTLGDGAVNACVIEAARALRVPLEGGGVFDLSFEFTAGPPEPL